MILDRYFILSLFAMVIINKSISMERIDSNVQINSVTRREIDGTIHHIKSVGITYQQRIQSNQCFVEYDNQLLSEYSVIKIRKKNFRVENCLLERVYHACGPNLLLMLSVVCRVLEQDGSASSYKLTNTKRAISSTRLTKHVITESCCENLCNISEITRYCHQN
ncbi:hypothetical protein I4U23_000510 [Adineta vaga]|nr:hypothetical protein I4U23_000510 [Adineta vaga]